MSEIWATLILSANFPIIIINFIIFILFFLSHLLILFLIDHFELVKREGLNGGADARTSGSKKLPVADVTRIGVIAMGRMLVALCYVWATIVDRSVGTFWKLGGGDSDAHGKEIDEDGRTDGPTNNSGDAGGLGNKSFEWWSFRAFWEGGRYEEGGGSTFHEDTVEGHAGWFSTPGSKGRMNFEAGWAGYFLDGIGLNLFGEWWPGAAYTGLVIIGLGFGGLTAYVLQTLCTPVR